MSGGILEGWRFRILVKICLCGEVSLEVKSNFRYPGALFSVLFWWYVLLFGRVSVWW